MADERTVAMIVNDLYYAQKDGCHKHVGTGRICYGCVEDALTAERKEVATLRARVAELERERECDLSYLVTCPWCAEAMEKRPISHQIAHLIRHGDERQSRLTQLEGALRRISECSTDPVAQVDARTALPALLHEVRQSRQGWIPVSERLPERYKYVMFWAKELGEGFCETGYLRETEWEAERTDSYNDPITYSLDSEAVTHWRELPAAPDKEQV